MDLRQLRYFQAIAETGCPAPIAIVPTSSKAKLGRGAVWRLMRDIVQPTGGEGETAGEESLHE